MHLQLFVAAGDARISMLRATWWGIAPKSFSSCIQMEPCWGAKMGGRSNGFASET